MILDATTRKIQVLVDAAATTTESPIVADYLDVANGGAQVGSANAISNGTTAVDVVAAPIAGIQRRVLEMSIENADTVNHTYTVRYNDNTTTRIIAKMLLMPGQTMMYGSQTGWTVPAQSLFGGNKASFKATKNSVDQTGIAASTDVKLTFTTEVWDTGSYYDAANSKWTPPAGPVQIILQAYYSGGLVDQALAEAVIYKNGASLHVRADEESGTAGSIPNITLIDNANGTDYYEAYANASGVGNKTVDGRSAFTFFCGSSL